MALLLLKSRTKEETAMSNPFWHMELRTKDVESAKKFYHTLFDWKVYDVGESGSTVEIETNSQPDGEISMSRDTNAKVQWLPYVKVTSIDSSLIAVIRLGGSIIEEKTYIPGTGWTAIIADPQGGIFGLFQEFE